MKKDGGEGALRGVTLNERDREQSYPWNIMKLNSKASQFGDLGFEPGEYGRFA